MEKYQISPNVIKDNWDEFIGFIENGISSPRREKLLEFYKKFQDRLIIYPASHKKEYHNAIPGGYIDHVVRVVKCALKIEKIWKEMGVDDSTYTQEEIIFSALNHDLGKIGDEFNPSYIPQDDNWRRDKLGEEYKFNNLVPFASVPDRSLYLLQKYGISYTFNEMLAIQTHDGLWDIANEKYLKNYLPEQKPRTSLPYIIHQADLMAARIEFEKEWLEDFKVEKKPKTNKKEKEKNFKMSSLSSVKSDRLKNIIDGI